MGDLHGAAAGGALVLAEGVPVAPDAAPEKPDQGPILRYSRAKENAPCPSQEALADSTILSRAASAFL